MALDKQAPGRSAQTQENPGRTGLTGLGYGQRIPLGCSPERQFVATNSPSSAGFRVSAPLAAHTSPTDIRVHGTVFVVDRI